MKPLDLGRKNIYSTNNMSNETKTISPQEIINFVFAQPRERRVEMGEFNSNGLCGCVMVQYGKEVLGISKYFSCGSQAIDDEYLIGGTQGIFTLLGICRNSYSYGEIQDILTARGKGPERKVVTKQEIVDYVFSQPREREVKMKENFSKEGCGCVMVQYGKERLGMKNFECGFASWNSKYNEETKAEIEFGTGVGFLGVNFYEEYTYGEIQKIAAARGFKPSVSALEQKTNNMNTVNTLHSAGFKVDIHHLRFPKQKTRRTKPMNAKQFEDTNQISPKGGKTVVAITKDGRIEFGESRCMSEDLYCRADGVDRAAARALEKFNA